MYINNLLSEASEIIFYFTIPAVLYLRLLAECVWGEVVVLNLQLNLI